MPELDGYEVCRRLREREETAVLPVIMVTASVGPEKTKAIEAGADDFIPKPFDHDELLTRVRSLLRIKRYHDTIKAQAAELLELNRTLEERVRTQVEELERLRRLRRFLSPQLADAIVSSGDESILASHRRQVAMFFADLRGWTSFVDAVEPEELMRVLGEFHETIGGLVRRFDATVGLPRGRRRPALLQRPDRDPRRRAAGGAARLRAPRGDGGADAALAEARLRPRLRRRHRARLRDVRRGRLRGPLRLRGDRRGHEPRLAARGRGDGGQILIEQRLYAEVEDDVEVEPVGELTLKGFQRPVAAFNVVAVREPAGGAGLWWRPKSMSGDAADSAQTVRTAD